MKRADVLADIPEIEDNDIYTDVENLISKTLDYYEGKFNEIRDLLAIKDIDDLEQIIAAQELAIKASDELY